MRTIELSTLVTDGAYRVRAKTLWMARDDASEGGDGCIEVFDCSGPEPTVFTREHYKYCTSQETARCLVEAAKEVAWILEMRDVLADSATTPEGATR